MSAAVPLRWRFDAWRVEIPLPFGAHALANVGAHVSTGDVVARGSVYRGTRTVHAARVLGCRPEAVPTLLRVGVGEPVAKGSVIARSGRRFPRAIVAGEDGRLVHLGPDGHLYVGAVRREWDVGTPLAGVVRDADRHAVVVEGEAWALDGLAAFGPARAGTLAVIGEAVEDEVLAARLDVSLAGNILVGGRRVSGEALTRAHAVGVHGVVAAAASFRALHAVYAENTSAFGHPTRDDVPTLLVLAGFGSAPFPNDLFTRLAALAGAPAAVDTRQARLYVDAPRDASAPFDPPPLALEPDLSGVR